MSDKMHIFADNQQYNTDMGGIGSGGSRDRAGRKPQGAEAKVKVSLRLEPTLIETIRRMAEMERTTATRVMTELLIKAIN